jgi:tRNA pseudouridine55 synthase
MDGVLIIDKPAGLTSHDVVAKVRRILRERRVGHTGTLDPFATGVLVVLVGRATRLAQFLSGTKKEYEANFRLGFATDTGDLKGKPLTPAPKKHRRWSREEVEVALANLRGDIEQVPPMFSAKKQGGKKLYELARRGEEVERKPVRVTIHSFEAVGNVDEPFSPNDDGTTDIRVRVVCSAGTYVRTLAEDFGTQLGVGAHVVELRRTCAGNFAIKDTVTLEQLEEAAHQGSLAEIMMTPDAAVEFLPSISIPALQVQLTEQGQPLKLASEQETSFSDGDWIRMRDDAGTLIALARYDSQAHLLRPRVVLLQEQ